MSTEKLFVHQRVWLYNINDKEGTHPVEGTITKIARLLVSIRRGSSINDIARYRIDTQYWNDKDYGSHLWFKTDYQREDFETRERFIAELRKVGITCDWFHGGWKQFTTYQLNQLAGVVS
jgi:hypothetical protein